MSNSTTGIILGIINFIYAPMDFLVPFFFFYCESFLQTLTVGIIGVLTICKILSIWDTQFTKILRVFVIIYYLGYTLYSLGIFTNLLELNWLDWTTFIMSVCAPIALVVLGKIISNAEIKGHKVFTYITMMLFYLLIAYLWYIFAPETLNFIILFIVWVITLVIVGAIIICAHFKGGEKPNEKK